MPSPCLAALPGNFIIWSLVTPPSPPSNFRYSTMFNVQWHWKENTKPPSSKKNKRTSCPCNYPFNLLLSNIKWYRSKLNICLLWCSAMWCDVMWCVSLSLMMSFYIVSLGNKKDGKETDIKTLQQQQEHSDHQWTHIDSNSFNQHSVFVLSMTTKLFSVPLLLNISLVCGQRRVQQTSSIIPSMMFPLFLHLLK